MENPLKLEKISNPYKYGGHDINFSIKAREMGAIIAHVPNLEAKHYRYKEIERGKYNEGIYQYYALDPISKRANYL